MSLEQSRGGVASSPAGLAGGGLGLLGFFLVFPMALQEVGF